jgi:hypothetical protein
MTIFFDKHSSFAKAHDPQVCFQFIAQNLNQITSHPPKEQ